MRRVIPALAGVVLLTAACASTTSTAPTAASAPASAPSMPVPSSPAPTPTPAPGTPSAANPAPTPTATAAETGHLEAAIPAARLPYKPAQGAPGLDDVRVVRTAADPCMVPADNSGAEAQLLDARVNVGVVMVTFEFTNPCAAPVRYAFHVTQAVGSAAGRPGGPGVDATTAPIGPGQSIKFNVNVNPDPALTAAQLQQLWVGVTRIAKA